MHLCVFIKILFLSLNTVLIVDKHCSDVCCDEFIVSQSDHKSKQVKEQWHEAFHLQSVWGKTCYFKHWRYQNLWMNNKGKGNKNAICLHFLSYMLNICRKFEFLISHGSVATCLRRGGQCCTGFVANFIWFWIVQKFWKSVKISQSYREFKVKTFLRHSVDYWLIGSDVYVKKLPFYNRAADQSQLTQWLTWNTLIMINFF